MVFLIDYNRRESRIVSMRTFDESERRKAQDALLALELEHHRKGMTDHEAVLLEAASEEALRKTHRRYFGDFDEALKSVAGHDE
ncbi:hypothetical protein JW916_12235 [Candidatus Sumerlaeota bacterium]|nr:hypothetical protein [Candidatus Sumerlaeota bacterium]